MSTTIHPSTHRITVHKFTTSVTEAVCQHHLGMAVHDACQHIGRLSVNGVVVLHQYANGGQDVEVWENPTYGTDGAVVDCRVCTYLIEVQGNNGLDD